ncbi:TonB-dependent receptor [Prolixibacteraceae bacterium Z1-6]|uniref:TonB-dependent receptor n=1 Tax=Draconibacterium aestuarii TaxID=2998507 RepID=A0A9X3F473_9BACT|nr:TonB-dependent receptor [Prolixibacteraceae bacterium Z1-6]
MKRNLTYLLSCLFLFTSGISFAQHTVTGVVYDAGSNTTLPGVNVVEKGTVNGTITNMDGEYTITVDDENATLVFSFIGFTAQEVPIQGKTNVDINLAQDVIGIEEVVAIGYGTQKKSDLTGAIGIVDVEEMAQTATNDVGKALQGKLAGVTVQGSGEPGAAPRIKIRGIGSFGDNSPLYVVDGVFAPINDIPMSSIQSVQVLKDASAAAIYGSRAANGVVIITTNRGKSGETKVNYSGYYGVQNVTQRYDMANREEYQMLVNEATENALYFDPSLVIKPANDPNSPYYVNNIDTDWQEEVFKTGTITDHNISVSGGNKVSNFNIGLNYFDQTPTVEGRGPSYKRYGISVTSDHTKGRFKFGESIHYTIADQTLMSFVHTGTMMNYMVNAIPTLPVYDDSTIDGYGSASQTIHGSYTANVVGMNSMIESETQRARLIGNTYGEFEIIEGLKYKLSLSYERTDWRDHHFDPVHDLGWFYVNNIAKLDDNRGSGYTGTVEQTLSYNKEFGKLNLNALAGHSALKSKISRNYGHAEGFSEPYFKMLSNGESTSSKSDEFQSRLISYFGRLILSYDDKYLVTGTIRRDGSSRFSPANKWGNFPSVAIAWKMQNESFMASTEDVISELKVRASYGILGNQNIGDYLYQGFINPYAQYVLNGQAVSGASQYIPSSPDVKWEQSISTNIGVDLGLYNNKLTFNIDYFDRTVEDMLYRVVTPGHLGWYDWESPVINNLSIKNSGFEFAATFRDVKGNFSYSISANTSTLKNEVLSLGYGSNPIYGAMSRTDIGGEVGEFYGWQVEKVFQTQTEIDALNASSPIGRYQEVDTRPGDFMFKDINGRDENGDLTGFPDGKVDDDDRTYLGSAIPNLYYGLNFNAAYKNFDFTLSANGASGNMVNNAVRRGVESGAGWDNYAASLLDRWTPENTDTGRPRVVMYDPNKNNRDSDYWLEEGSYLRIANVELGYNFSPKLLNKVKMSSLRLYVSAQNLHTFTKYSGFDPDFNNDGLFSRGTDQGAEANKVFTAYSGGLPNPRTFLVGVKVGFL